MSVRGDVKKKWYFWVVSTTKWRPPAPLPQLWSRYHFFCGNIFYFLARQRWPRKSWRHWRPAPWRENSRGTCQGPEECWSAAGGNQQHLAKTGVRNSWGQGSAADLAVSTDVETGQQPPRGQGAGGSLRPKPDAPRIWPPPGRRRTSWDWLWDHFLVAD